MPYQSDAQRRFMHARHPGIASRWDQEIRENRTRKGRTVSKSLRYGNGGGVGRRIPESQLVEVEKKKSSEKASFSRHAAAQVIPGIHGLIAGKPGGKISAAGNELGGGLAGWAPGYAVAHVGARMHSAPLALGGGIASLVGTRAGIAAGVNRAQRKGHYVPQRRVRKADVGKALPARLSAIMNRSVRSGSLGSGVPNRGVLRPLSSVGRHRSSVTDATPAYAARLRRNARQGSIGQGEYVGRRRRGGIVKADLSKGILRQSVARPIARRAATATLANRGITQGRLVAMGGAGARKGNQGVAKGRRWMAPSAVVRQVRKRPVGKARYFDPDDRRARRSGVAIGAATLLGGAALARGGAGAVRSTKLTRQIVSTGLKDVKPRPGKSKTESAAYATALRQRATRYASQGVNVGPRDLAYLGGGGLTVGGAAELHRHGNTRRGGRYT